MTPAPPAREVRVRIERDVDVVTARQEGRALALLLGFSSGDATVVATAISELARNIVLYAKGGEIVITLAEQGSRRGLKITARDEGTGIRDVERVLRRGYSTSGGLGLGLPGVRRMMDEFELVSQSGKGTVVTVKKWRR
ncbi:MAG: ATP-binding protein [Candidatus Rokuibacteriota bacterium]|nr:MAG: ATP-binding protein [Candidatus Rokubacteria bacterium]